MWGNTFAWKVVGIFMSWAFVFLLIPSKVFKGPVTSFGYVPLYSDNGFFYYITSIAAVLIYYMIFLIQTISKNKAHKNLKCYWHSTVHWPSFRLPSSISGPLYQHTRHSWFNERLCLCTLFASSDYGQVETAEQRENCKVCFSDISQTCYYTYNISICCNQNRLIVLV